MMIVESNPIPVKWALHYLGKIGETLRLPLIALSEQHHMNVVEALTLAECEKV
jgi:4-hydroxy-tetrahydrodipicolinate synthase